MSYYPEGYHFLDILEPSSLARELDRQLFSAGKHLISALKNKETAFFPPLQLAMGSYESLLVYGCIGQGYIFYTGAHNKRDIEYMYFFSLVKSRLPLTGSKEFIEAREKLDRDLVLKHRDGSERTHTLIREHTHLRNEDPMKMLQLEGPTILWCDMEVSPLDFPSRLDAILAFEETLEALHRENS